MYIPGMYIFEVVSFSCRRQITACAILAILSASTAFFLISLKKMIIDSFEGQKEGEEIVAVWRQHLWVLARPSLIAISLILIGSVPMAFWSPSWSVISILLFVGIAGIYLIIMFYLWFNTIYILTNERVFSIYQNSVFSRTTNEVPLKNIQNASHSKKGIFQMLLDFGQVDIQTAGSSIALSMRNVNHPYQVQQVVLKDLEK